VEKDGDGICDYSAPGSSGSVSSGGKVVVIPLVYVIFHDPASSLNLLIQGGREFDVTRYNVDVVALEQQQGDHPSFARQEFMVSYQHTRPDPSLRHPYSVEMRCSSQRCGDAWG